MKTAKTIWSRRSANILWQGSFQNSCWYLPPKERSISDPHSNAYGFHAAKCVEHCIGKYIQGSGIEESFWQAKVFGVNVAYVVDTVLNKISFKWSFKGYLILILAIEK